MPPSQLPGAADGSRNAAPAAASALLAQIRLEATSQLLPLLAETLATLDQRLRAELPEGRIPGLEDDLANLTVLRNALIIHERRWQAQLDAGFAGWPQPPPTLGGRDGFGLVSEDELQSQLVGEPAIEALQRHFADVLEVISSRLWSFAAAVGGRAAPSNPVGPRRLVESFLAAFPAAECNRGLREQLLRQYERLAAERLGGLYAWTNTRLADAGHAMSAASDYAMLMASPLGRIAVPTGAARAEVWSNENALAPSESSWRDGIRRQPGAAEGGPRTRLLRQRASARRAARDAGATEAPRRRLGDDEFLAVLALVQGEAATASASAGALGPALRAGFARCATGLGMSADGAVPGEAQEDALDLVAGLFDGLFAGHALADDARAMLSRLAPAYLQLALSESALFDEPLHPAMAALSLLVQALDANHGESAHEAELHAIAERGAKRLAAECGAGSRLFDEVLRELQQAMEVLRRRAELAERRAWQALHGRERLQAAREQGDRQLQARLGQALLASVAGFLAGYWRQALVQAWLREGADSARLAAILAVGDALVRADGDAARAEGHAVAGALLTLQQPLRECCLAGGLDEGGAADLLAALVAELARPDAARAVHRFAPLADPSAALPPGPTAELPEFEPGHGFVLLEPGRSPQALRLAWRSELSGARLLVDRQGMPQRLLAPAEFAALLAGGSLVPRDPAGPVEALLRRMAQAAA